MSVNPSVGPAARGELDGWWRLALVTVGGLFRLAFRLRFSGVEHVPSGGPAILASNHVSVLDGPILAMAPPRRGRVIRFLVVAEAFEIRFISWGLRRYRQIPLRRGEGDAGALDEAVGTIRRGALAGIFPEGRVSPDGALQRGRTGVARLALATGAPVIPVGVWGTQRRWPKRGFTLRGPLRPAVALAIGKPIPAEGDADSLLDVAEFTSRVMDRIEGLAAEARARAER